MATGRRGPAPQPAAIKRAKGNPGNRPIATAEQEAEAARLAALSDHGFDSARDGGAGADSAQVPSEGGGGSAAHDAPDWLSVEGREIWDWLAPRLTTMKILQQLDVGAFGRYCNNFGRWVKLQKRLDAEGETYESESPHGNYVRANPAFMMADRLDRACERAEANFALNPADRQRLFAARAAAGAGAGLFDHPSDGAGGEDRPQEGERRSPIGLLN